MEYTESGCHRDREMNGFRTYGLDDGLLWIEDKKGTKANSWVWCY